MMKKSLSEILREYIAPFSSMCSVICVIYLMFFQIPVLQESINNQKKESQLLQNQIESYSPNFEVNYYEVCLGFCDPEEFLSCFVNEKEKHSEINYNLDLTLLHLLENQNYYGMIDEEDFYNYCYYAKLLVIKQMGNGIAQNVSINYDYVCTNDYIYPINNLFKSKDYRNEFLEEIYIYNNNTILSSDFNKNDGIVLLLGFFIDDYIDDNGVIKENPYDHLFRNAVIPLELSYFDYYNNQSCNVPIRNESKNPTFINIGFYGGK